MGMIIGKGIKFNEEPTKITFRGLLNSIFSRKNNITPEELFGKSYDYKKNLEHLKERYLNKIEWLEKHTDQNNNTGIIYGLLIAIHDIEDILDELEV
jgi:hypothetical protein